MVRPSQIEDHMRRQIGILDNAQATMMITMPEVQTLAQRVLRRRWIGPACLPVGDGRAITKRPYSRPTRNLEKFIDRNPTAVFFAGARIQQRIWRRARGPDKRFGRNSLAIAQLYAAVGNSWYARRGTW